MNLELGSFWAYPHVPKVWGEEIILTNTPLYCAKFLHISEGMQCSLHRHAKTETFFVLHGKPLIQVGEHGVWEEKQQGDMVHLPGGTWHRFGAVEGPAVMLEVSTEHSDTEVERLAPSGPLLPF